jgi:hypothetical protein
MIFPGESLFFVTMTFHAGGSSNVNAPYLPPAFYFVLI